MDQLKNLGPLAALGRLWNQLNSSQRVVVAAFAAVSIVAMVVIGMVASKPRMAVLFSRLEPEDAGAICQKLSEQKVPYQLSADSSTVEVPASQVDDLRLAMTAQGLPQGGTVGFELFDKSSFGMTEFTERLNYQRAVQGELSRTIEHLAPVINARVHVAMPQDKLYTSEQDPVTASVVLKLKRGSPLGDEQVGGIVHLVASAVEGLKPENVTVVDNQGNVLSEAGEYGGGGHLLTASQTKLKRQYETELARNIESMLARILGPDKAVVRVSADMNFDQKQVRSESYEPAESGKGQGVLQSETKSNETYTGSTIPSSVRSKAGAPSDNYTRTESTNQYEVTKRTEETVSAPGQLKRLSVAVLVDDKVGAAKVTAIRSAVATAAGTDAERGDQVTVQSIAFDDAVKKAEDEAAAKDSKMGMISSIGKTVGAVVLLLGFLMVLKGIVKQIKVQLPAQASIQSNPVVPQSVGEMLKEQGAASQPATEQPAAADPVKVPVPNGVPKDIAQSSPEELARLVRTWMSEG
jgi:flagellar M-ring protein FliF